jgi:hypothetical protein
MRLANHTLPLGEFGFENTEKIGLPVELKLMDEMASMR